MRSAEISGALGLRRCIQARASVSVTEPSSTGEKGWAELAPAFAFEEERRLSGKIAGKWFSKIFKPVDEFALKSLGTYREKKLTSIDSADIEVPQSSTAGEKASESTTSEAKESGFPKVLELFREALGARVRPRHC